MYPVGILFGLGFDTATEVALLVLAGSAAGRGLPLYAILCLPILFAAGMWLLDTLDGSFMNFAYGWAFSKPVRKVFYNLTITGLSVAVALGRSATIELRRTDRPEAERPGRVLDVAREHQHQHARVRRRRDVRHDLGRRPVDLAAGRDRGAMEPPKLRDGEATGAG